MNTLAVVVIIVCLKRKKDDVKGAHIHTVGATKLGDGVHESVMKISCPPQPRFWLSRHSHHHPITTFSYSSSIITTIVTSHHSLPSISTYKNTILIYDSLPSHLQLLLYASAKQLLHSSNRSQQPKVQPKRELSSKREGRDACKPQEDIPPLAASEGWMPIMLLEMAESVIQETLVSLIITTNKPNTTSLITPKRRNSLIMALYIYIYIYTVRSNKKQQRLMRRLIRLIQFRQAKLL